MTKDKDARDKYFDSPKFKLRAAERASEGDEVNITRGDDARRILENYHRNMQQKTSSADWRATGSHTR